MTQGQLITAYAYNNSPVNYEAKWTMMMIMLMCATHQIICHVTLRNLSKQQCKHRQSARKWLGNSRNQPPAQQPPSG